MSLPRIINLGFPKSGTTTLARALREAGLTVADFRLRQGQRRGFVGGLMYRGYFDHGDPLMHFEGTDALTEVSVVRNKRNFWPQCDFGLIQAIRDRHPDTKFLLSMRDPAAQADSMMRWSDMGSRRLRVAAIPGLPKEFGASEDHLIRWIEGHFSFCHKIFDGAENFLAYRIEDTAAPEKISDFLGLDLPWWGVENANPGANPPKDDELKKGAA
ncbi:sulfotransferase [Aliiroseovarius sp.]|uniref:sulfotransferase n=1 Tax=Aliiroseovarius sp. TaxID=1872442 RepID=UPI003BAD16CC